MIKEAPPIVRVCASMMRLLAAVVLLSLQVNASTFMGETIHNNIIVLQPLVLLITARIIVIKLMSFC